MGAEKRHAPGSRCTRAAVRGFADGHGDQIPLLLFPQSGWLQRHCWSRLYQYAYFGAWLTRYYVHFRPPGRGTYDVRTWTDGHDFGHTGTAAADSTCGWDTADKPINQGWACQQRDRASRRRKGTGKAKKTLFPPRPGESVAAGRRRLGLRDKSLERPFHPESRRRSRQNGSVPDHGMAQHYSNVVRDFFPRAPLAHEVAARSRSGDNKPMQAKPERVPASPRFAFQLGPRLDATRGEGGDAAKGPSRAPPKPGQPGQPPARRNKLRRRFGASTAASRVVSSSRPPAVAAAAAVVLPPGRSGALWHLSRGTQVGCGRHRGPIPRSAAQRCARAICDMGTGHGLAV
ncbi:hypothetical protein VFPBJ_05818 [Purpureocillium lilacinum]|uniref:Uncharacterized protein n=1 Tax=Purpureocillium lilacinum TaxID=33203 RepID=A0A179GSD2_PURLI|nr:hypothetical protein VFPBJ_05818 [Purpureocillium lilacinum]